jgi:hypothetical protein
LDDYFSGKTPLVFNHFRHAWYTLLTTGFGYPKQIPWGIGKEAGLLNPKAEKFFDTLERLVAMCLHVPSKGPDGPILWL